MSGNIYAVEIGKRLKEIRNNQKMTQTEFGDMLGYTQKAISEFERGNMLFPTDAAVKLCDTLNVDMDYVLRGAEYTKNLYPMIHEDTGYASLIDLYQICPEEDRPLCINVMKDIVAHLLQKRKTNPEK